MPQRIKLSRAKGWRKPAGAIVVSRPSRFGNPFRVTQAEGSWTVQDGTGVIYGATGNTDARRFATTWYRAWLSSQTELLARARAELTGHDLACWCPLPEPGQPDWCHGRVLLDVANGETAVNPPPGPP